MSFYILQKYYEGSFIQVSQGGQSMKRISSLLLIIFIICLSFNSCAQVIRIDGIDNFNKNDSALSLNQLILPSDDFLDCFKYENADYHYRDSSILPFFSKNVEQSIVVINYKDDVYEEAKEYCMQEMVLSDSHIFDYNGYTFIDHEYSDYPYHFNMFVYNDEKQCLIFLGFHSGFHENVDDLIDDWGSFLDKYYSEFYDFS